MNGLTMRHAQYLLRQLGPAGLAGLGLLLLALLLGLFWIQPAEQDLQRQARKLQNQQGQLTRLRQPGRVVELSQEEQLERFYGGFPATPRVPDLLDGLYRAAAQHALELETGEYALIQNESDTLARYRVALPVKGSFAQVLSFMDASLRAMPSIALESANFKREKVDDAVVEAKLVFLVYVRARP